MRWWRNTGSSDDVCCLEEGRKKCVVCFVRDRSIEPLTSPLLLLLLLVAVWCVVDRRPSSQRLARFKAAVTSGMRLELASKSVFRASTTATAQRQRRWRRGAPFLRFLAGFRFSVLSLSFVVRGLGPFVVWRPWVWCGVVWCGVVWCGVV